MRNYGRRILELIRGCWKTMMLFEIIFRLFSTYLVFPACKWLFNSSLRVTGLYYLTAENLPRFLASPVMLLCCAALFLIFSLTAMLEISCLITCMHSAQTRDTLDIFSLVREGGRDTLRLLRPRSLPLLLITAMLIPLTQLPTSTSLLRLINLPWKSLAEYALKFPYILLVGAYIAAIVVFFAFAMCVYHRYVLENVSAMEALRGAVRMSRAHRGLRLAYLAGWIVLFCLGLFGGAALVSFGLNRVLPLLSSDANVQYRIRLPFDVILNFIKSSFPSIGGYACIGSLYYLGKTRIGEPIPPQALPIRKDAKRFNSIVFYIVATVTVLCVILYDTVLRPALARYDALQYISGSPTLIIAHRGYCEESDENTLSAFEAAYRLGADYIELDVQQTADGVVIVQHDPSFRRVFGDGRMVWQTPFDETRSLASGISGEYPPTLHEVLTLCDPRANLLIELKNNGHNPDLPQAVYDILAEYNCLDRCVIQSSSYQMLRQFKALCPDMRCGYILSFALGEYASLRAADFFSIDAGFVSEKVLNTVHHSGKALYAWTINDDGGMRRMLTLGVDGIITDNLPLAKTTLLSVGASPLEELIADPLEEALTAQTEGDALPEEP